MRTCVSEVGKIRNGRDADDRFEIYRLIALECAGRRDSVLCCHPQRQMAACGMPGHHRAGQVEIVFFGNRAQMRNAISHIIERTGIAAAGVPHATIGDAPNCHAVVS